MDSLVYIFGILIAVVLTAQVSEAIPTPSLDYNCNEFNDTSLYMFRKPENCDGVFCRAKRHYYPQEQIDCLLTKKYQLKLQRRELDPMHRASEYDDVDCQKDVAYSLIYEIIDEHGNVRVVVQSDNKHAAYQQEIRIEWCHNPGLLTARTQHFDLEHLSKRNISCIETKLQYYFLVLTHNWQEVEFVKMKEGIPVSCNCRSEPKEREY